VGEVKARMALALGKKDEAAEHIRFVTNIVKHSGDLEKTFRCLETLLAMEEAEVSYESFIENLNQMYGEAIIKRAFEMLAGENVFFDLPQANDKLEGFKMHTSLIAAYQKLQDAKDAWVKNSTIN